eukprot:6208294-Pleurochrysis_carterae.AAC.3
MTEAVAASLVGLLFFHLTSSHIKNSGTLEDSAAPLDEVAKADSISAAGITKSAKSSASVYDASGATSAGATEPAPSAFGSSGDPATMYASGEGLAGTAPACAGGAAGGGTGVGVGGMGLATSLLPQNKAKLDDVDFVGITPDDTLKQVNFLSAGWQIGRDTKTTSLRNPSYDLRSEPANPRTLTPENNLFLNSTIGFDSRRTFEPTPAFEVEK